MIMANHKVRVLLVRKTRLMCLLYFFTDFLYVGMDIMGPISLKASSQHRFIFVVVVYFTKRVEVASYANVTKSIVIKFSKKKKD
ncbi:protein NYNRIN-like [Gossypium australe]|uniref:Protein NYNRIN-like n=1 Tax=Gossypium australe TaxID=47621 RepID=A0A5B6UXW2_9ROSI|nr:protein NYNRIN-like [Gossypium australe]